MVALFPAKHIEYALLLMFPVLHTTHKSHLLVGEWTPLFQGGGGREEEDVIAYLGGETVSLFGGFPLKPHHIPVHIGYTCKVTTCLLQIEMGVEET